MGKVLPALRQDSFRARNDDGTEATATWKAAQDTNWTQRRGQLFRLRFRIQETAGAIAKSTTFDLWATRNGGTAFSVSPTSGFCRAVDSPNVTDGGATTKQLAGGAGAYEAGQMIEDGISVAQTISASNHTEHEFVVELYGSTANGDVFDFRVRYGDGTLLEAYGIVPRATAEVLPSPAAPTGVAATNKMEPMVSWIDNATNEDGYYVHRLAAGSVAPTGPGTRTSPLLGVNAVQWTDNTGLATGTSYDYWVEAVRAGANSSFSATPGTMTSPSPPAAITNLAAAAVNAGQIDLTFTPDPTATSHRVRRRPKRV